MIFRTMRFVFIALVAISALFQVFWTFRCQIVQVSDDGLIVPRDGIRKRADSWKNRYRQWNQNFNVYGKPDGRSNIKNIFAGDFDPTTLDTSDASHFCITAGMQGAETEFELLLKSILLHSRRLKTYLHIIAGDGSEEPIKSLMERITNAHVPFLYEIKILNKEFVTKMAAQAQIEINHHSGVYGMSKAFLFLIWQRVEKCIFVDTDAVFGTDPAFMWAEFEKFDKRTLIMMRLNERGPHLMGAGIVLLHLQRMRDMEFNKQYPSIVQKSNICDPVDENGTLSGSDGKNYSPGIDLTFATGHNKGNSTDIIRLNHGANRTGADHDSQNVDRMDNTRRSQFAKLANGTQFTQGANLTNVTQLSNVIYRCQYMEQGMLFSFFMSEGRKYFMNLDHSWCLEYCHRFDGFTFEPHPRRHNGLFFGVAHLNCIKGEHKAFTTFINHNVTIHAHLKSYIKELMRADLEGISNGNMESLQLFS